MTILDPNAAAVVLAVVVFVACAGLLMAAVAVGFEIKRAWASRPARQSRTIPTYGRLASSH